MKNTHIFGSLAAVALTTALLLGGCGKKSAPPATTPTPAAAQGQTPAQPAQNPPPPPTDQAAAPPNGPQQGAAAQAPPPPPAPATIVIPAGTHLRIRLDQDLGSKISQPGETFEATVADEVVVNGQTVIPRGARAEGIVVDAKPLGRFKGGAVLELRLERVRTQWGSYPVATSTMDRAEKGKGKRTAGFIGGGGAFGAIIGGLAGGGKGALIGGLAGAGAGTAGTALTGNKEIFLPAETLLTFRLEHSVHITRQ